MSSGVTFHSRTYAYEGIIVPIRVQHISYMYALCCEVRPHTAWALTLFIFTGLGNARAS